MKSRVIVVVQQLVAPADRSESDEAEQLREARSESQVIVAVQQFVAPADKSERATVAE